MARPLIEDTARNNLASWTSDRVTAGAARGAVINPFCTGPVASQSKPSAQRIAEQIQDAGGEVWFDPMTHVLHMPNTGDFRYYEQWSLWDGSAGMLTTRAQRRDHVQRVFDLQSTLGAPRLAPTILAHSSTGAELVAVMALLEDALDIDPGCWATISGTPSFWSGGPDLDALVGTLAQMSPGGWFLSVARADDTLPVRPNSSEIAGMCRTVRSLSEFTTIHISHGDLAGMPAVAAGADSVSTGWDARQRVLQYGSFTERLPAAGGGGWFQRPTFEGLLAFLPRAAAELMFQQDGRTAQRLFAGQLHPTGPKEAFNHHLDVVATLTDRLSSVLYEDRYEALRTVFESAKADWSAAAAAAQRQDESDIWIDPFLEGLREYGATEGW